LKKSKFKSIENVDIWIPKNVRYFRDLGIDTIGIECLNLKCEFGYLAVNDLLFGFGGSKIRFRSCGLMFVFTSYEENDLRPVIYYSNEEVATVICSDC
jgi:hypothetical protein